MGLKKCISHWGDNLNDVFQSILDPRQLCEIARRVGFFQRFSSRLQGDEIVRSFIIESAYGAQQTLRGTINTLGRFKRSALMSIQGFSKRINTAAAAALFEEVLQKALSMGLVCINKFMKVENETVLPLASFPNVYLQDSSECLLDKALKHEFKGSGGGSGNGKGDASVKIDLIYEYKKKHVKDFKVTDRREQDAVLGRAIIEIIKSGDLVIRDLGYSCLDVFMQIQQAGAYFLSRLVGSLSVYLSPGNNDPLSLGKFLEKKSRGHGFVDEIVYLGRQMFQCRMIAYRVPPEIERQRRAEYLKECQKKKRKPSEEYIQRLSFTIFITNVPLTIWSAQIIGTIYRLRWQVELIFKSWKSNLNFDHLIGKNVYRIRCLLYARLTAIVMMFTVYSCIDRLAIARLDREISIHKVIDWFLKHGRWYELVIHGFGKGPWKSLIEDARHFLCKEKRKRRKTTRELVLLRVPFGCITG